MADSASQSIGSSGLPAAFEDIISKAYGADTDVVEQELADQELLPEGEDPNAVLEGEEVEVEAKDSEEVEAPEEPKEVKPLEDTPQFKQLGKRAQGRIQELTKLRDEQQALIQATERRAQEREAQYAQYLQQVQYQAQVRDQQVQAELERYRSEMAQAREARESQALQEKFKADPVAKFEHEVLSKSEKRAEELANARVAEIERRLQAREQAETQAARESERKARFSKWDAQLNQVVPEMILQGVEDKQVVSKLGAPLKNLLLAYAASGAQEPAAAAKEFSQIIDELADLRAKVKAKAAGQVVAKNKGLPGGSTVSKTSASTSEDTTRTPVPPKHVIAAMGFENAWEWRRAGSPTPTASR